MQCGLLGRKLGHSYSPTIHAYLGDYSYELFEKEPEELHLFLRSGDFRGLNVTIPYKKEVIPFLDEISPIARRIGSVNTIVRRADGTLYGHNTDYYGFLSLVQHAKLRVAGKKVLVLGSGGTSNTVVKVLEDLNADITVISRSSANNYGNLHLHQDAQVIVNTTPVGMFPNTGAAAVNIRNFPLLEGVLDVVYNPARTQILLDAESLGLPNANGLWMLVAQAKESAEYFLHDKIDDSVIEGIYRKLSAQMKNIVLIGMPGCGKTTIGSALAKKSRRIFVDADEEIVRLAGKPISQIFAQDGEDAFRALETDVLNSLGKRSGIIIATGGGCVTMARNYPLLHQNGEIFWIQRDLSLLPTDGRPLSQANPLSIIFETRQPLYARFSDAVVENSSTPEAAAAYILKKWEELI